MTICARFLTYQFTKHLYTRNPAQGLLVLPDVWILWSGWSPDIVGGTDGGMFSAWDLGVWNHVCVALDSIYNIRQTTINGEMKLKHTTY